MLLEYAPLITAIAAVVVAVVAVLVTVRLMPLVSHLESLARETEQLLRRVDGATNDLAIVVRDARHMEQRVSGIVHPLLDQVEPPARLVSSALAGLRAGVGALLRADARPRNGHGPATPTPTERSAR